MNGKIILFKIQNEIRENPAQNEKIFLKKPERLDKKIHAKKFREKNQKIFKNRTKRKLIRIGGERKTGNKISSVLYSGDEKN